MTDGASIRERRPRRALEGTSAESVAVRVVQLCGCSNRFPGPAQLPRVYRAPDVVRIPPPHRTVSGTRHHSARAARANRYGEGYETTRIISAKVS